MQIIQRGEKKRDRRERQNERESQTREAERERERESGIETETLLKQEMHTTTSFCLGTTEQHTGSNREHNAYMIMMVWIKVFTCTFIPYIWKVVAVVKCVCVCVFICAATKSTTQANRNSQTNTNYIYNFIIFSSVEFCKLFGKYSGTNTMKKKREYFEK